MHFKSCFVAIAAAMLASTGAMAASHHHAMPPPTAPAESAWNGLYVGVTVGGGSTVFTDTLDANNDYGGTGSGESFGVEAGYDTHLTDKIVAGIVADVSDRVGSGPVVGDSSWQVGMAWDASIRARLGLDMGSWMPYVTAGYAAGNSRYDEVDNGHSYGGSVSGWTVGAGVEVALANHWTAKIEYRRTDYGTPTYDSYPIHIVDDSIRVGVDYHF